MPHGVYEQPRFIETFDGKCVDIDRECREEQMHCEKALRKAELWAGKENIESYYYDSVNIMFPGQTPDDDDYANVNPKKYGY